MYSGIRILFCEMCIFPWAFGSHFVWFHLTWWVLLWDQIIERIHDNYLRYSIFHFMCASEIIFWERFVPFLSIHALFSFGDKLFSKEPLNQYNSNWVLHGKGNATDHELKFPYGQILCKIWQERTSRQKTAKLNWKFFSLKAIRQV